MIPRSRTPGVSGPVMVGLLVALAQLGGRSASAVTQTFESNTTINYDDLSYEGMDIVVHGCVVTINGEHWFNSLRIERDAGNEGGVVTHDAAFQHDGLKGMFLHIANDVTIEGASDSLVASALNVNDSGYASGEGPGTPPVSTRSGAGAGYGGDAVTFH